MNTRTILFFTVLAFCSCKVVELESESTNEVNEIIGSTAIASNDSLTMVTYISGTMTKSWNTSEFTLMNATNMTSCRLDDIMIFNTDGTYRYDGGSNLCGAEDNQKVRIGQWVLDHINKRIIFDKGRTHEYVAQIIGLDDNEIRLKGSYFNFEVRGKYKAQ